MNLFEITLYIGSGLFLLIYLFILFFSMSGLRKIRRKNKRQAGSDVKKDEAHFISIIIPFRNEEENLPLLLSSLQEQTVDKALYEIILVNDHSSDRSETIIERSQEENISLLQLPEGKTGKKSAIQKGVQQAKGNIILTTDADCKMDDKWLEAVMHAYVNSGADMLIGPVMLKDNGFFSSLQKLEFMAMQGITFGAGAEGNPVMCNGANLAYKKNTFEKLNGYEDISHFPSGDDVMLLQKMKKANKKILLITDPGAVVYANPSPDLRSFFDQRVRWGSKTKHYRDPFLSVVAVTVFLLSLCFLLAFFLSFFNSIFAPLWIAIFAVKGVFDLMFLSLITSIYDRQKKLLVYAGPLAIVYPFYIVVTGILIPFLPVKWKGRKYKF